MLSEGLAAPVFKKPAPRPAPDAARGLSLERRADQIAREVCDRRGVEVV